MGVALFIVSEALFFLAIFWAYFHSALSPTVELGAQWPPLGIEAINAFELPLLNTVLLLASGVTITYSHHSLIQGNRNGALYGALFTIILALIFTGFQGVEYSVSSFTISDGAFGSCFYFGTGFHGLITVVPTNLTDCFPCNYLLYTAILPCYIGQKNDLIVISNAAREKIIHLDKNFLEWLIGFTDAEGNFNLSLKNFKDNSYHSLMLTFQIGLHIDDIHVLNLIKNKLGCGHISISGNRCNYFVNDRKSLINVIKPIFNFIPLNSSKYYQYLVFEKALDTVITKHHLTFNGKLDIISYYHEMKQVNVKAVARKVPNITVNWLIGFTEGDGTFSSNKTRLRFKLENNVKEMKLILAIKNFLGSGNILTTPARNNGDPTVVLEINTIGILANTIIPMFNSGNGFTLKKP